MNWKLIPKEQTQQPQTGTYTDWKEIIAKEGFHQCVYCSIHESRFGGIRNFHIEHYRPKSLFKHLTNIISNLFYACAICNTFKGKDWYEFDNDDDFNFIHYPNPSVTDYSILFNVNEKGILSARNDNKTGLYLINKLALNRPQIIIDRKYSILLNQFQNRTTNYKAHKAGLFSMAKEGNLDAIEYLERLVNAIDKINNIKNYLVETRPYERTDTDK